MQNPTAEKTTKTFVVQRINTPESHACKTIMFSAGKRPSLVGLFLTLAFVAHSFYNNSVP